MYIDDGLTRRTTRLVFMCCARSLDDQSLCCSPFLQQPLSALCPAECQENNEYCLSGIVHTIFLCYKGSWAAGTSACTKSAYHRISRWWIPCGPALRPSLSEQQCQVSGSCTWKHWIMSIHSKESVLSTQLRSLVPIGCSRLSMGGVLSAANVSNITGVIAQNG